MKKRYKGENRNNDTAHALSLYLCKHKTERLNDFRQCFDWSIVTAASSCDANASKRRTFAMIASCYIWKYEKFIFYSNEVNGGK